MVVGRILNNKNSKFDDVELDRYKNLWDRLFALIQLKPGKFIKSIASFGWWFSSGRMPIDWSISNLSEVIKTVGGVAPDFLVMERLEQFKLSCSRMRQTNSRYLETKPLLWHIQWLGKEPREFWLWLCGGGL